MSTTPETVPTEDHPTGVVSQLRGALHDYVARVRGGDMGVLPALLAMLVLTVLFWQKSEFFLTRLNIANLFVQASTLMVFTCALVFLIILTELDLSAGVTGGTAMAVFIKLVKGGWPWGAALFVAVLVGVGTGLLLGFFVAKIGVPAFVVTLGFFLGYQGLMLVLLGDGGIFRIETKPLKAIMNDNLKPWMGWLMFAVIAAIAIGLSAYDRTRRAKRGLPNPPMALGIVKVGGGLALAAAIVAFLNANRSKSVKQIQGVPIVVPIVLLLLFVGQFVLLRTRFGLHIYAVGGNPEAARRAGINVTRMRISGFVICSTLSVVAGLFHASRVGSIESTAGRQIVLSAVGAAVVGGVSLFGGRGNLKNAAIGAFVIAMIDNGLGLLQLKGGINFLVTGGVLVLAASVDALSRKRNAAVGR